MIRWPSIAEARACLGFEWETLAEWRDSLLRIAQCTVARHRMSGRPSSRALQALERELAVREVQFAASIRQAFLPSPEASDRGATIHVGFTCNCTRGWLTQRWRDGSLRCASCSRIVWRLDEYLIARTAA